MKKTTLLGLPIYDKPSEDKFKLNDWNIANENIERAFSSAINGKSLDIINTEVAEARGGEANLKSKIGKIDTSLEQKAIKGKIVAGDLDTSTDANKLKLVNLSDEVKQAIVGTTPINSSVANDSVVKEKIADKAVYPQKINGIKIDKNLINKDDLIDGYYVDETTGNLIQNNTYKVTDYIKINPSSQYYLGASTLRCAFYDASKVFISGARAIQFTTPSNAMYIRASVFKETLETTMLIETNSIPTSYIPFSAKIDWLKVDKNGIESIPQITPYDIKGAINQENLFDKNSTTDGYYLNIIAGSLGNPTVNVNYTISDFIPADENTSYTMTHSHYYVCYDKNKNPLYGTQLSSQTFTTVPNTAYIRVDTLITNKNTFMIVKGDTLPSEYVPFGVIVPWLMSNVSEENKQELIDRIGYKKSKYQGYKLVCFGDSITGGGDNTNQTNDKNYVKVIEEDTGIITYKQGYHSARMAKFNDTIRGSYSMYKLVDAIISKNFSEQENALVGATGYEIQYATLQRLKTIDFSTIDFVTLAFGTNDFLSNGQITLDNPSNKFDVSTYKGATRYVVKRLQETYPRIKIMLLTPIYRYEILNGVITQDGKTWTNPIGDTLIDYVDALLEVGSELNLPVVDMYRDLGINEFNRLHYFASPGTGEHDGTHPHHNGTMLMGHKIAGQLTSRY